MIEPRTPAWEALFDDINAGWRDAGDRTDRHYQAIAAEARAPLDVERLARALPVVASVLWAGSVGGDHQQVWFDEDVLRHFHEWADDTAATIAAEYARLTSEDAG